MNKKIILLLVILLSTFSLVPVSATSNESNSEKVIMESLEGFYDSDYDKFQIYYNDSEIDQKDTFLFATKNFYQNNEYNKILNYFRDNLITIVKENDHSNDQPMRRATDVYPIKKSWTVTQQIIPGVEEVKYTVTFSGSYYVDALENKVTNVVANYNIAFGQTNPPNLFKYSHTGDKFTKTISGLSVTLTLTTKIVVTYTPSATTGSVTKTFSAKF